MAPLEGDEKRRRSPHFSSGRDTNPASSTAGACRECSFDFEVEMFSPPEMIDVLQNWARIST